MSKKGDVVTVLSGRCSSGVRGVGSLLVVLVLAVVACSCSGGGGESTSTVGESVSTAADALGLDWARGAVVQIVGTGTFRDPVGGEQANVAGSGSGFIVDASGLAVTNNHVVTGAAFLEVFVQGESEPFNARVVGVSECSDLAVIDVDGDGFTALEWYTGEITTGLPIFAAGYPLGDPEYTLLEGIVAKEDANGETAWASVDAVIEHSADTLPGSSGGPILTAEGEVVAVNYAGNQLGQTFAIGRDDAKDVVDQLIQGADLDSIGVNGEALVDEYFSGIWVYSVESGSPADLVGVAPGDLITRLEGLELASDGTMSDYCDILRSHQPTDQLAIEVYRVATDEVLEGRLNGAPLAPVFSFATEVDDLAASEGSPDETQATAPTYSDYRTVTDDSASIAVDVPVQWNDIQGSSLDIDGTTGPALTASPDIERFSTTWGTPGVSIFVTQDLGISAEEMLDIFDQTDACDTSDRIDYDDGTLVGMMDIWVGCGTQDSTLLVIAAEPPTSTYQALALIAIITNDDIDAADQIIRTLNINNPQTSGFGDLSVSQSMTVPACDGSYITVLGSAVDPATYAADIEDLLARYPGSRYLRTDVTGCSSLRPTLNGNAIYAAYFGPFSTLDGAERACGFGSPDAYIKPLDNISDPARPILCP